ALAMGQRSHRGDPEVHQLDGGLGQVVAVEPPMLGVGGGDQLLQARDAESALSERAGQLEALVLVAQIRRAIEALALARYLLAVEPCAALALELAPRRLEPGHCAARLRGSTVGGPDRADEGRADVGVEQPPRREHAGPGRDD